MISILQLFRIGIGPSSSHTVGPMRAARQFALLLSERGLLSATVAVRSDLYGSLGATGRGHGTDRAVLLGLEGREPDTVEVDAIDRRVQAIREGHRLHLLGHHHIAFAEQEHLVFHRRERLPYHPNGIHFTALDSQGHPLVERTYYSVGGGFVVDEDAAAQDRLQDTSVLVPYPFKTAAELLRISRETGWPISQVVLENERAWRSEAEIRADVLRIWSVMQACVARGCEAEGILPGGLKVPRRAADLYRQLRAAPPGDPLLVMEWVNLFALAVNEQNAAGGRVVTAPTNGAAGIIPAVLHYYTRFVAGASEEGVIRLLLTAGAIGMLFKEMASLSGAEVGCQGEVGVACSMAAGGLAEVLGGSPAQVENAAEIGMEHHLGLTCDPIGGLVQIPCIERNAIASVKAINAARMALRGNGSHVVSLDKVIRTMRQTGADMSDKYKETARGGLAVNIKC